VPFPPPAPPSEASAELPPGGARIARRLRLSGHVQGVGFRPFVHRLATELALAGSVQNLTGEVEILIEGAPGEVARFCRDVLTRAPPLARPRLLSVRDAPPGRTGGFEILDSARGEQSRVFVPPDSFTCPQCLAELNDPADPRYRYPFINCTQCGPRYTLIVSLPYDRPNTTLSEFPLCDACREEYENPGDRRFHAEPVACAVCGPKVWLEEARAAGDAATADAAPGDAAPRLPGERALARAVDLLLAGGIVAVKGVGGYHLLCDATNEAAVRRLRERKRRPDKPLAVMFAQQGADGLASVGRELELTESEARLIASAARPIVLTRKRLETSLAPSVAPGLAEIGAFLPYSPLHHLLLAGADRPLIATSGNPGGEPVLTDVTDARAHLTSIADASLHHDRPIARPADDSVVRTVAGRPRTLRLGRGLGPLELELPWRLAHPVLAVGGHLKTTVALAWEDRVVMSPHIADMGTARSMRVLEQVAGDLQRLYGVRAAEVVCDAHPDYATTRWAESLGLPVTRILHHHAHASGVAGETDPTGAMLVFAWDGAGLGEDGALWGGETFLGVPGAWRRVASLRPFRLPGGDLAARAPWRSAAAVCWEIGAEPPCAPGEAVVRQAWRRGLNCIASSSAGRLFDAAAALVLDLRRMSFEGQAPMLLEAAAARAAGCGAASEPMPLVDDASGLWRADWEPLVRWLLEARGSPEQRARAVHQALAATIGAVALRARDRHGIGRVALTGGVFQNALLAELASRQLTGQGFTVFLPERVPCNDGGLSYGQVIELAARQALAGARQ
jgi:hydrogenase maturation protein HypF